MLSRRTAGAPREPSGRAPVLTCGPGDLPRAHLRPAAPRSPGGLGRRHGAFRAISARAGSPACRLAVTGGGLGQPIGHKGCHSDGAGPSPPGAWLRSNSRPAARGRAAPQRPNRRLLERLAHLGHNRGTSGAHPGHGWGMAGAQVLRRQEAARVCNSTDVSMCMWSFYGWRSQTRSREDNLWIRTLTGLTGTCAYLPVLTLQIFPCKYIYGSL